MHAGFTKWGDLPHWRWEGRYLGDDEYGRWWWAPEGTHCSRPGAAFDAEEAWVSMTPHTGAWVASFYPAPKGIHVYVDMATPATWSARPQGGGWAVGSVDLDLDVVLLRDGTLYVDDEDEFALHRLELGYPPEVCALAEAAADEVLRAVGAGTGPFGGAGEQWLRRVLSGL